MRAVSWKDGSENEVGVMCLKEVFTQCWVGFGHSDNRLSVEENLVFAGSELILSHCVFTEAALR